jgi:L-malate glycosyltransferase
MEQEKKIKMNMKRRILLLSDVNSSHTKKWAGGIALLGYEVHIFSLTLPVTSWYDEKGIYLTVGINENKSAKSDLSKLGYINAITRLKKLIAEIKPDIVHAHYATSYGLLGVLSGFHPFIISVWGSDVFDFPNRTFFHKQLLRWNLRHADVIFSTGKILAEECSKYTNTEIKLTPFGIDIEKFRKHRSERNDEIVIGIIKSLEKTYGIEYLIRAFEIAKRKLPDVRTHLLIVGSGSREAEYRQLVNELDISPFVTFTGSIPHEAVPAMQNAIDIFVCPSLQESFGVSVLEACACEVPVIVTAAGGLKEIVLDGVTGLIVPVADEYALAAAMEKLANNKSLREELGKNGRRNVLENYDWQKNLQVINDIYTKIISA